jgi:hypothetical protein
VLSALPLGALGTAFGGGTGADGALAFKLLRLPRLLRLSRLLRKVRMRAVAKQSCFCGDARFTDVRARFNRQLENMSSVTLFRVMLLVSAYVLIGHWAACLFFYISKWQARASALVRLATQARAPDAAHLCSSGTQPAAGPATVLDCCRGS